MEPASVDPSRLARSWVHSHEEDAGGEMVFRSADFEFPPSRGRTSVTFAPDGTAEAGGPGPDDRTVTSSGSWALDGNVLTVATAGLSGTFEVEALDEDRLVLRRQEKE